MHKLENAPRRILVTGGAGFIGSALVRHIILSTPHSVLAVDKLTYAGNRQSLDTVRFDGRFSLVIADICDKAVMRQTFSSFRPDVVMHLAAESHVDRSIDAPADFVRTNVVGTCTLLDVALEYYRELDEAAQATFVFHHVSTDEVFGSLGTEGLFDELTPYDPRSPYSASKAASDHFVRAWYHTYGLPVVLTNCSNNYGPYQFPEKLIPLTILNAIEGKPLPVYGKGENVRDWLHVDDHVEALMQCVYAGKRGETYCIGGNSERANINIVRQICGELDSLRPRPDGLSYEQLITFVTDRPGHDLRYAIDASKVTNELGWRPRHSFEQGLASTIEWFLNNNTWWQPLRQQIYSGVRLGTGYQNVDAGDK